ncbi:MAG: MATE family efflux transporter, partial [Planctomyces sp.]
MNENSEDNVSRGSAPDHDRAGSLGELIRVALPLVLSAGSHSMMSAADRMILTGYSADALAAVTPASMLHWTSVCIPLGTILYANTFIAQFDGAGRKDRMIASLWQSVWLAIISGILLPVCLLFSRQVFALTGQPTAVVEQETIYFNALCLGSVFLLGSSALSCFFSGRQRTSVVMWVSMMGVVLNFVMDYVLVFGIGPFPMMGIRGAAVATVLARCCEILVYQYLIRRELRREEVTWSRLWLPDRSLLLQYLRFGVPSGLHYFVDNSGFTAFLLIVGSLGRDALAATNLAFSVNGLIFVPLL